MNLNIEVKGKAERYRVYKKAKLLRAPNAQDGYERAKAGLPPLGPQAKIRYDGEQIAQEGDISGTSLSLTPKDGEEFTKVVLYSGDIEEEKVVGSGNVTEAGPVSVELTELPEQDGEVENGIVDE